jgi:broad specificity phosphatase PhoE
MELYLVRHGETVDNVAGLYAGVRDSALTNHGVEQARRLGHHFRRSNVRLSHVFASPLSRALKTAEAVVAAQKDLEGDTATADASPEIGIVQVPDLIEQNFGFYEGKAFQARADARKIIKGVQYDQHRNDAGFVDVESKESMCKRADAFIDEHLVPLFFLAEASMRSTVLVVSHGILLGNLWRRILARLPAKSVSVDANTTVVKGNLILEHLGGWSNTGYLHLMFSYMPVPARSDQEESSAVSPKAPSTSPTRALELHPPTRLLEWSTRICAIDSKEHLIGLKRQRGGIGSLAHDKGQKKLDGFFKRQRTNE